MSQTLPHTALVTSDDVYSAALSNVDSADYEIDQQVIRVIRAVTEDIERYLNRRLIVRPFTWRYIGAQKDGWKLAERLGVAFPGVEDSLSTSFGLTAWARAWPVVEHDQTTDDLRLGEATPGGQRLFASEYLEKIEGYAGYKRPGQTLSDLQGESGLSGLTAAPDDLPWDVAEVACNLALYRLMLRKRGKQHVGRVTQGTPESTWTLESIDQHYEHRQLGRIARYRRVPA
jgi:hypothetical protein